MNEFKGLKLEFTTNAYLDVCENVCEIEDLQDKFNEAKTSQKILMATAILTALANGYIDKINFDNQKARDFEFLARVNDDYCKNSFTISQILESMKICMEEIAESMNVDIPSGITVKEKDYELEEIEKEKKIV